MVCGKEAMGEIINQPDYAAQNSMEVYTKLLSPDLPFPLEEVWEETVETIRNTDALFLSF